MELKPILQKEFTREAETTRKMLERVPDDKFDWKPHEKSMTIRQLVTHIAEIPGWTSLILNTEVLDFAGGYHPTPIANREELLACFEKNQKEGNDALENATEADLLPTWTMKMGDHIISADPKHEAIRHALSQNIHHRAQLGVFLRLLDIPIPGSYGPSADDQKF